MVVHVVDLNAVEFLEGISDLKDARQVAVYVVVCLAIYARQGPVANNPKWISGMAKMRRPTETSVAIGELLALGKLRLTDDGRLTNNRCERQLAMAIRRMGGLVATRQQLGSNSSATRQQLVTNSPPKSGKINGLGRVHDATTTTTITKDSITHTESVAAREANGIDSGGGGGVSEHDLERLRRWRVPNELEARLQQKRRDITTEHMRSRTREWREYAVEHGIPRDFAKSWLGWQMATPLRRRVRSL